MPFLIGLGARQLEHVSHKLCVLVKRDRFPFAQRRLGKINLADSLDRSGFVIHSFLFHFDRVGSEESRKSVRVVCLQRVPDHFFVGRRIWTGGSRGQLCGRTGAGLGSWTTFGWWGRWRR